MFLFRPFSFWVPIRFLEVMNPRYGPVIGEFLLALRAFGESR